jgi:membrane protease YdiL (CAAX protease family)
MAGLAGFPIAVALIAGLLGLPILDALLLALLLELLPALAVAQVPAALRLGPFDRSSAYATSGLTIAGLAAAALAVGVRGGRGPEGLGLVGLPAGTLLAGTAGVLAAAGAVVGLAEMARRRLGLAESGLLERLLPRSARERWAFGALSLVAGLGEEVAFRGFAIAALGSAAGGPWGAAVVTSVAFGLLHAYQGLVGVVRTAVLGLVLAASLVQLGSLWPAIVAHVIIDLAGGLWLGPRLTGEPDRAAAAPDGDGARPEPLE